MDLLSAMRIFVRVVERGSLSGAARDLGIGQPAVSERIDKLEQHLGARLLRRSTRAVSCTDAGARFYEHCRIVLAAAQDAQDAVARDQRTVRGTLRLAAPQGLGEVVLPALLIQLRERHPELDIDLVLNDRVVDPVTEGVDLSLRLGDPGVSQVVARRLGEVRRVLVASPAYLDRHGAPATPQALAAHPFARVAGLFGDQQLPLVDAAGKRVQARVNIAWNVSHWRPVHELIVAGAAIGVLQAPVCADALASGALTPLLPGYTVPGFALHALYPAARPLPAKTRAALTLLEQHLPALLD
jgi:DNA-binding transcriptional LysR family regulator